MFDKATRWLLFVVIAAGLAGGILSGCSDNSTRSPQEIKRIQQSY
jgi:hypothetical protein